MNQQAAFPSSHSTLFFIPQPLANPNENLNSSISRMLNTCSFSLHRFPIGFQCSSFTISEYYAAVLGFLHSFEFNWTLADFFLTFSLDPLQNFLLSREKRVSLKLLWASPPDLVHLVVRTTATLPRNCHIQRPAASRSLKGRMPPKRPTTY